MNSKGFNPTTFDDNEKLAATCIESIAEFGPQGKVAVKSGGMMAEAFAAVILSQCWHRRTRLEREAGRCVAPWEAQGKPLEKARPA